MLKCSIKHTILVLIATILCNCGGGSGSGDDSSNILQTSGRFAGSLQLAGNTCGNSAVLQDLPYTMDIRATNLENGPSHFIDEIGDNMPETGSYYDFSSNSVYGSIDYKALNPFLTGYNCSEGVGLTVSSADESNLTASKIRVERTSSIFCDSRNGTEESKYCYVYYIGVLDAASNN